MKYSYIRLDKVKFKTFDDAIEGGIPQCQQLRWDKSGRAGVEEYDGVSYFRFVKCEVPLWEREK